MTHVNRIFIERDGSPLFVLGAQSRNSSGYNDAESDAAFRAVKALHGNTLEIPVYWGQVEPEEGRFDFTAVDALIASARRHGLRLVLLWFATWKNGDMDYAPDWVKRAPERFKRVVSPTGWAIWVLSSHCRANWEADRRAYVTLCQHLKDHDQDQRTVIAVQIENEPGILGSDRDYGPEGQADYEAPVPDALIAILQAAVQGPVYDLWQATGAHAAGNWSEVFGQAGGELMTAWSIATYIDGLAEAGKAAYDLPMYVNVWLGENGWAIPGESYPSGGPVSKVLDIYKTFTPHVDLIAPDIYIADSRGYEAILATYARDDNALFVPESAPGRSNAWLLFRALADYNAIGYAFFAVEHIFDADGAIHPDLQPIVDSMRCTSAAIPLLLKYQGTDQIHAVVQEEDLAAQRMKLEGYTGMAEFHSGLRDFAASDWRHLRSGATRGRGLVFQAARHEFYVVGAGFRLALRPDEAPERALDPTLTNHALLTRQAHYISVDEGHFDADGEFIVDRRRNGDEFDLGIWVSADTGVVRAVLCD